MPDDTVARTPSPTLLQIDTARPDGGKQTWDRDPSRVRILAVGVIDWVIVVVIVLVVASVAFVVIRRRRRGGRVIAAKEKG
jgi:hypothetical protein